MRSALKVKISAQTEDLRKTRKKNREITLIIYEINTMWTIIQGNGGNAMREKGTITELNGDMAIVKVERFENTGCGCGNSVRKNETLVEARNRCKAGLNDQVYLDSNYDWIKFRSTIKTAVSFGVLILGMAVGNFIFPRLGLASVSYSIVFGLILAAAAFLVITKIFKRRPLSQAEAAELVQ
jgi:hypothetical protein